MRIILFLLIFLSTQFLVAQSREDSLKTLSIDWMKALERKDSIALERYLAPEFTLSSMGDSDQVDRATWMRNAIDKTWGNTNYQFKGVKIQGDHAIVNSIMSFTIKPIPFKMQSEILDHWIYRNGRWTVSTRYLGADSFTNFIKTAKGFLLGVALMLIILLFRRYRRNKKERTTGKAYTKA